MKSTQRARSISLLLAISLAITAIIFPFQDQKTVQSASILSSEKTADTIGPVYTINRVTDHVSGSLQHYSYQTADGSNYHLDTSSSGSTNARSSLKKIQDLPSGYDLRTTAQITPIKNQGVSGACWAFASVKAIESNLIRSGISTADSADFSENHLTWFTCHPSTRKKDPLRGDGFSPLVLSDTSAYDMGGSSLIATFSLARWSGVIPESKAPFHADTEASKTAMAKNMKQHGEPLRYHSSRHLQNATCYDTADQSIIKQALLDHGALTLALYYTKAALYENPDGSTSYYQTLYNGSNAVRAANHSVTIIGWDDNYPCTNFAEGNQPASDGAWLIANSYGTSTGDNGYFWLSYEEPSICDIYSFETESADNYDTNYQYDGFGWGSAFGSDEFNMTGANIFKTGTSHNQSLKAIGLYTITDNQPYTIKIYKNVKKGKPTKGTLAASSTTSGIIPYSGFHTITLDKPVSLSAGQNFSVVVTYRRSGSAKAYLPVEGTGQSNENITSSYTSKAGQSFFYHPQRKKWYDTSEGGLNNICIKAYAKNRSQKLKLSKKKLTLGKRETYSLKSILNKASMPLKLKYTSNKPGIAKVNANGKITAKRKGSAVITVTNADGAKSSLRLTVKKAPSFIRAKTTRKTLKKGKTFRIKTKLSRGSASQRITYHASNKRIVSVSSSGKVKGKKAGSAIIRIKTYNKKTARVTVKVVS